jgi:hypothetical protein
VRVRGSLRHHRRTRRRNPPSRSSARSDVATKASSTSECLRRRDVRAGAPTVRGGADEAAAYVDHIVEQPASICAHRTSPSSRRRHRCCRPSPATTTWST